EPGGDGRSGPQKEGLERGRERDEPSEGSHGRMPVGEASAPQITDRQGRQEDADDRAPDVDAVAEMGSEDPAREDLQSHQHGSADTDDPVEAETGRHARILFQPVRDGSGPGTIRSAMTIPIL